MGQQEDNAERLCADYLHGILHPICQYLKQTQSTALDMAGTISDRTWDRKVQQISRRLQGAACKAEIVAKSARKLGGQLQWIEKLEAVVECLDHHNEQIDLQVLRKLQRKKQLDQSVLDQKYQEIADAVEQQADQLQGVRQSCRAVVERQPRKETPSKPDQKSNIGMLKFYCRISGAFIAALTPIGALLTKGLEVDPDTYLLCVSPVPILVGLIVAAIPEIASRGSGR